MALRKLLAFTRSICSWIWRWSPRVSTRNNCVPVRLFADWFRPRVWFPEVFARNRLVAVATLDTSAACGSPSQLERKLKVWLETSLVKSVLAFTGFAKEPGTKTLFAVPFTVRFRPKNTSLGGFGVSSIQWEDHI